MFRNIQDLREDNDLTQNELAHFLSVTRQAYARYEKGQREVPKKILLKLAIFYNTSTDYLLRTNYR